MFSTLIESRAPRARRTGSSMASIMIHAALIGWAGVVTARETIGAPAAEPRVQPVVFDPMIRRPVEQPKSAPLAAPAIATAPRALVLLTPAVVPTEIPPIDLTREATPVDFSARRVAPGNLLCYRDCAAPAASGGTDAEMWTANDVMMRLREDPVPPRYPESLRRAGIDGSVVVKFVVDTLGRVDMASLEIVSSTHEAFTAAVREAIARFRFNPSQAGNRKVPALAMMPFQFRLR
jgi:protein TonB